MSIQLTQVLELAPNLARAASPAELHARLHEVVDALGATTFSAATFPTTRQRTRPTLLLEQMPAAYLAQSGDLDAGAADPVMQALRQGDTLVNWNADTYAAAGMARLYEPMADYGLLMGTTVALHVSPGRHFVFGLEFADESLGRSLGVQTVAAAVQAIAVFAEPAAYRLASLAARGPSQPRLAAQLTARELQVLHWVAAGMTDKLIGTLMGISPRTARKHVDAVVAKLGASNRTEAAVTAVRQGLLPGTPPAP